MALANSATPADNSWILTADPSTLEFVRPYPYDKEGPALSRAALASREGGGLDSRGGQVWQCFHSPFHYARSPTPFAPRPFLQYDSDGRPISPMIMRGPTPDRPPVSVRMPTRAEINKRKKEEAVIGKYGARAWGWSLFSSRYFILLSRRCNPFKGFSIGR